MLRERILEIFKECGRARMPFSKFVMMHAQMYPSGYHQPSHEGICNRFSKLVQIVSTTNSKEVNLQFFFLFYMRNCAIWSKHLWG